MSMPEPTPSELEGGESYLESDRAIRYLAEGLALRWRTPAGGEDDSIAPPAPSGSAGAREDLASLAARHRVAGALYRQAAAHDDLFPADLARELGRVGAFDALICDAWLSDIQRLLEQLSAAAIPAIVTKGWALTATVFGGDTTVRPSGDIDVLVRRADLSRARRETAELGYVQLTMEPWPGFDERYGYAAVLRRPDAGRQSLEIELHWGLFDVPYFDQVRTQDWFRRATPIDIGGAGVLAPAREDHFVYLCGHLALHHHYDRALFRYHDMAALVTSHWPAAQAAIQRPGEIEASDGSDGGAVAGGFDWDAALERAIDWRLAIPVGESLVRLADLWPEVVPRDVLERVGAREPSLLERRIHYYMAECVRTPASHFLARLITMPGVGRRIRFAAEQMLPSPDYMRRRYATRRPALWPLGYIERARRGIGQALSR